MLGSPQAVFSSVQFHDLLNISQTI